MPVSTITTKVKHGVTLGNGIYAAQLTVAATGAVAPVVAGATAITGDIANAAVTNYGAIAGAGGGNVAGGTGIDLMRGGTLSNDTAGTISGGAGGTYGANGTAGGDAVVLGAAGTVYNAGLIAGGAGGSAAYQKNYFFNTGGAGGTGLLLKAGGSVDNASTGIIQGGAGGYAPIYAGASGVAVVLGAAGTITNAGTILGGTYRHIVSNGQGIHGATAIVLEAGGSIDNSGTVAGGAGSFTLIGTPVGGNGIDIAAYGTVTNSGLITGGYASGGGVLFRAGGVLDNIGTIGGANGANASYRAGGGGAGAYLAGPGTVTNAGMIAGGGGGSGGSFGGVGGVGVFLASGALTNTGVIAGGGGGGGLYANSGAAGGAGVVIGGGTLTNAGTISGGAGRLHAPAGDAVQFGAAAAGTLIVDPGAVFHGKVAGNGSNDTLVLASADSAGTLSGLGNRFAGFTTVTEAAGANWTLSGTNAIGTGTSLSDAGLLRFNRSPTDDGSVTVTNGGRLILANGVFGTGTVTIGNGATLVASGAVSVANVAFTSGGSGEDFLVKTTAPVTSALSNFGTGDTIDLRDLQATGGATFHNDTLTLYNSSKAQIGSLSFLGSYTRVNFTLTSDGFGGTDIGFKTAIVAPTAALQDLVPMPSAALAYADTAATVAPGFATDTAQGSNPAGTLLELVHHGSG